MRKVFGTLLVGLMLTVSGGIVRAGPYENATAAYQRGDFATVVRLLRPLAEKGLPEAQYDLGVMYDKGQGVHQDYRNALIWYRSAAENGLPEAQYNLGAMYATGQGVGRDFLRAHMWSSLAASRLGTDEGKKALQNRDSVGKLLKPAQVRRAQEMARQCEARSFKNCG